MKSQSLEVKSLESNNNTRTLNLMKKIVLSLLMIGAFAACTSDEAAKVETIEAETMVTEETVVKVVNVNAEEVKLQPFTSYIRLVGEVKAKDDIRYSAEVSGKLLSYSVDQGGYVKAGQVFAKIDDEMLTKDVERMEAMVAAARENYERLGKIWNEDSIGTELGYLNAKYNYEQSKASLDQLKIQLRKTRLTSPVNGVIETQLVKAGEMVSPGMAVVRIIGTDNVKIEVGVPANYAGVIGKGDGAVVSFDAYPSKEITSTINYVASSIQTQSRTFKVELHIPNTNNELKIDMVANVILETNRFDSAIVVPQEFVFRTENGYEAFVVKKDANGNTIARSVKVNLGPSFDNKVVVSTGLSVGDKLITTGSGNIENMSRVLLVDESSSMAYSTN